MEGRAKKNLPGGSLKYKFVCLKTRVFKCSTVVGDSSVGVYSIHVYIYCIRIYTFLNHFK